MPKIDTEIDVERELEKYDALLESLWDDLGREGIFLPERPARMPTWPADIMRLTDTQLWQAHADFQEYYRFVAGKEAYSKAHQDICSEKAALVRAAIRKRTKGPNKEVREDSTIMDSLYQEMRQQELYWCTLHAMFARLKEIFDEDVKALSRQLNRLDTGNKNTGRSIATDRRPYRR